MVSPRYLFAKPKPPSALKRQFDQQVLPAAIDAAAGLEVVVERLAQRARRQPFTALCAAFGFAFLATRAAQARVPAPRRRWIGR